jgi:hypothetical protein
MDTCISVYNIQISEGLSDLLEPHFCCDRLHFTGEPREVSDEVRAQLQVAVTSPFDPEGIIRRLVHNIIICLL